MGGRGRGRGRPMGPMPGDGKEIVTLVLQPPMTYPPLEYKPIPMEITTELSYLYTCKKAFADYMEDSPNKIVPIVVKKDIERYSDQYQKEFNKTTSYHKLYDWSKMPAELKPVLKKKAAIKDEKVLPRKKKMKKELDINSKLSELEQKENMMESADEDEEEDVDAEDKDPDEEIGGDGEEVDEEMDEGTDYVNSYFDNGENYGDEDDDDMDGDAIY